MKNLLKINLFLFTSSSKKLLLFIAAFLVMLLIGMTSTAALGTEVSETVQNLIRSKNVTVIYYSNPGELYLNPKNEADSLLIKTPMYTFQKAFTDKGFNVLDPNASIKGDVHYVSTFLAQVRIVEATENSEARAMIQAILEEVGTGKLITKVESKGMQVFPKTDSGIDIMQNLSAALKQSAEQIAPKLTNSLIGILYEHAESGVPVMMQLSVGKKSQLRTFMRMLKKIKGVNVTMLSQAGKEMTMRINYKGTETDDLLMALDDAFYSNRKFQGYALEFDQMGNNLHLKIVTDE
jgi:hypothetical protein